jgi:hypothetical protein
MLKPASGTSFRVTEGYLKAGSGFLKRVLEQDFHFKEANRNFILILSHEKTGKYCENHQRSYNECRY